MESKIKSLLFFVLTCLFLELLSARFAIDHVNFRINNGGIYGVLPYTIISFLCLLLGLLFLYIKLKDNEKYKRAFVILSLGIIFNLMDRVIWGGVVDYFPLFGFYLSFGDLFIAFAISLLVLRTFKH